MSLAIISQGDVVVTIKPLHSLVTAVIGEQGSAKVLIKGQESPHDFVFKPSQAKLLNQAKIIFYLDNKFEFLSTSVFKMLPKHIKKSNISQTPNLKLLPTRKNGVIPFLEQGEVAEKNIGHTHTEHFSMDFHFWLDPQNAQKIVKFVAVELSKIYPQQQKYFHANAKNIEHKLKILAQKINQNLEQIKPKPFIVFHDAFQYFEKAFGLNSLGSIALEPEIPQSLKIIQQIHNKIKQAQVKCVFSEPQFSSKIVKTVIKNTQAKHVIVDPLGSNLTAGKNLYFKLMENLTKGFNDCLQ